MVSTFNSLYKIILAGVAFIIGSLELAVWWYVGYEFIDSFSWQVPFVFLGIICGVITGGYVWVLLRIPFELTYRFDVIKNKVALREYKSVDEFQNDVSIFVIDYFKFPGLDVKAGYFHFKGAEPLYMNVDFDIDELISKEYTEVQKVSLSKGVKAVIVPIVIGDKHLGKMVLFTKGFTLFLMKDLLSDFENQYLDDQLLHVVYDEQDKV